MIRSIEWSDEAKETFDVIVLIIEDKWSTRQASVFIKRVRRVLQMIAVHPDMYKASISGDVRQAVISKQTSMYYKVEERSIIVLYFWDNRQEPLFELK
nr:type II toxin-antitoxin system RelE/ParE family toxin [uncultured Mucilaginibacter sp.]